MLMNPYPPPPSPEILQEHTALHKPNCPTACMIDHKPLPAVNAHYWGNYLAYLYSASDYASGSLLHTYIQCTHYPAMQKG